MSLPRLKDYRAEKIDIECRRCDRYAVLDRKALVKKYGASCQFVDLKRALAIGCDRKGADHCEARFPCLLRNGVLTERGYSLKRRLARINTKPKPKNGRE